MTRKKRQGALCLIGIAAALLTWPLVELAVHLQAGFPAYLGFSVFLGALFGLVMGAVFGTAEGITLGIRCRIRSGLLAGALIGAIGGIAGSLTGQAVLFFAGDAVIHSESARLLGLPLARAAGWLVLGGCIGAIEGIRSRSRHKLYSGVLGGITGGFLGGLLLEYSRLLIGSMTLARLVGLLLFGFLIGLFYGLAERRLSAGVLRCLNGAMKGHELILNQRRIRLGSSPRSDISIRGYRDVTADHALLTIREERYGKRLELRCLDPAAQLAVNDQETRQQTLRPDDVFRLGGARFQFRLV